MKRFQMSQRDLRAVLREITKAREDRLPLTGDLRQDAEKVLTRETWARLGAKMGFDPDTVELSGAPDGYDLQVFYAKPVKVKRPSLWKRLVG